MTSANLQTLQNPRNLSYFFAFYDLQRGAKNSYMFEFPTFLAPTNLVLPLHSPSALTEHVSLNLARFFLLDPVWPIMLTFSDVKNPARPRAIHMLESSTAPSAFVEMSCLTKNSWLVPSPSVIWDAQETTESNAVGVGGWTFTMSYVKDVEYPMCDVKNGHFSISHVCYSKFFAYNDFS